MSQTKIDNLTPDQEALIPVYRNKWRAMALSTERIDRQKAAAVIKAGYAIIGEQEPEILFFDSPYAAFRELENLSCHELDGEDLLSQLRSQLDSLVIGQSQEQLQNSLYIQLQEELQQELWEQLSNERSILYNQLEKKLDEEWLYIPPECDDGGVQTDLLHPECSYHDFCISVLKLNFTYDQSKWEIFHELVKHCGWIFTYRDICIACDRPIKLSFDNQSRLHAEAEPAIQFADGFSVYAYRGISLPEKYGKLHSNEWKAEWILEERNAELRRVLIQGIGYSRICSELQATELDSWAEYSLLKIDNNIDVEPICLLKMTCPSTGFIHVLRVPPNIISAREAIRWVNWGIDPEEFSVQT